MTKKKKLKQDIIKMEFRYPSIFERSIDIIKVDFNEKTKNKAIISCIDFYCNNYLSLKTDYEKVKEEYNSLFTDYMQVLAKLKVLKELINFADREVKKRTNDQILG